MIRILLAALCAVVSAVPATCQDVVLVNLASIPRKQWVDVALPAADAAALPQLCRFQPRGWIAFKGPAVGQHSVLFHVLGDFLPQETVSGTLVGVTNQVATFAPWGMSDWVADDTLAVMPRPVLLDTNGLEHRLLQPRFELVENESPARRVFKLSGRLGTSPIAYEGYLYVYVGQDVVHVESTLTCADPRLSGMSYDFALLWIESGEFLHLDYRTRLGMPAPFVQTAFVPHPSHGDWVQVISGPRTLGRGEGLHVSGSMLCLPSAGRTPAPVAYATNGMTNTWSVADRVDELVAEHSWPCVGMWRHWEGKWLAFGEVPEVPIPHRGDGGAGWANGAWATFRQLLNQPADLFAQRPRGLFRNAASTGAQEDFGACKGAQAVTVGDPRWIYDAGYSVTEVMMRAFHYREVDGSPMRAANHPGLQCFNQLPNCRTTTTSLGYPCPLPYTWPTTGWTPWDDQHRSHNNFLALLALTGSWSLRDQLRDLAEVDNTQVPNWLDSPRAEGRLAMARANMLLLLEDPAARQELLQTMSDRIAAVQNLWPGRQFVGNAQKPVRAMEIGSDPTFLEPNSSRVPALVTWEHSIAAMGFFAAWRVTGDSRQLAMAREVSRVVVERCCFQENGRWIAATAIRYLQGAQEGDALPPSSYYTGSPDVHVSLNFWPWILPAVLICREVHATDAALVARCNAILQDVAPNGPNDWATAEWWAVLPR